MTHYIILGISSRNSAVRRAVFGDAVEGRVPNARYLSLDDLCGMNGLWHRLLVSPKLRGKIRALPGATALLDRLTRAHLRRHERIRPARLRRFLPADPGARTDFIFCPSTNLGRVPESLVAQLRALCPDSRMIFYLVDGVERTAVVSGRSVEQFLGYLRCYDAVLTYSRADARRWPERMCFVDIPVRHALGAPQAQPAQDLYFCGRDKDRSALLFAIHGRLARAGVRLRADVVELSAPSPTPDIASAGWIPYDATVAEILRSNCLLEILAEHNREATLRYKEAVIHNRKLLTDNPDIASLPYYDPRWMRTFRNVEDIDPEWVRAAGPVDYGYRGDYSVERFLQRVEDLTRGEGATTTTERVNAS